MPSWITCEESLRRLDDYLDRRLSDDERDELEAHLAVCTVCAHEYRFEANVVDDVRAKLRRIDVPGDLAAKIAARLARGE